MKQEQLFDIRLIFSTLGSLLFFEAGFMAIATIVALFYREPDVPALCYANAITFFTAILLYFPFRRSDKKQLKKREGYLIVSSIWIVFSFFGSLPFLFSGYIPGYANAFFETISGFTTTGATILSDIEALPHGLLFWRSIIQWLGGMGIIVLSLAVLPIFGIGGMQLYVAEVPGPTKDKIRPRVAQTAKLLWSIYAAITMAEAILLYIAGMNLFDAVCHAFTTISTGGYSTKNASIAYWNSPFIDYIVTFFMIIAGMNYTLLYTALRGNLKRFFHNEEIKYYLTLGFCITAITIICRMPKDLSGFESIIRSSIFQSFTLMTGTGFSTSDFMTWGAFLWTLMLITMMFGGCAGSTSGGIKTVRLILLIKNSYFEFKRLLHPNAIIPVKFNDKVVQSTIVTNVLAFVVLYATTIIIGIFIFLLLGINIKEAVGASVTSIGNVGPGLGNSGPSGNFSSFPDSAKWVMSFLMLTGRLEIFTVLFVLSPSFWKK